MLQSPKIYIILGMQHSPEIGPERTVDPQRDWFFSFPLAPAAFRSEILEICDVISMSRYTEWMKCLRSLESIHRCGFAAETSGLIQKSYSGVRFVRYIASAYTEQKKCEENPS